MTDRIYRQDESPHDFIDKCLSIGLDQFVIVATGSKHEGSGHYVSASLCRIDQGTHFFHGISPTGWDPTALKKKGGQA